MYICSQNIPRPAALPARPAFSPSSVARVPVANHVKVLSRLALQFIEVRGI